MPWNLEKLHEQIKAAGISVGRCPEEVTQLQHLATTLSGFCGDLPEPQVDTDCGEFELCWINVRLRRWVSFAIDGGKVFATWLNGKTGYSTDLESPTDQEMDELVCWACVLINDDDL